MKPTWQSECGTVKLWRGDCIEVMKTWPDDVFDTIISVPPYGSDATHARHLSAVKVRDHGRQSLAFDGISEPECIALVEQWCAIAQRWVVFTCEWRFMHALPHLVRFGIWRKPDGAPQFTGDRPGMGWEAIAICHRAGRKRWHRGGHHAFSTHSKGPHQHGHPTGKPVALFEDFMRDFTELGKVTADPFMGSGTTGVAAVRHGRQFWGVEIDPDYFEIARRRIEEELTRFPLFENQETTTQKTLFPEEETPGAFGDES